MLNKLRGMSADEYNADTEMQASLNGWLAAQGIRLVHRMLAIDTDCTGISIRYAFQGIEGGIYYAELSNNELDNDLFIDNKGVRYSQIPEHLLERLRVHANDEQNTASARSTMRDLLEYFNG